MTLRIISALGAALVGAWLPGFLNIRGPGFRAGGALAIMVLFFIFDPPAATNEGVNKEAPNKPALNIPGQPPEGSTSTPAKIVAPPSPTADLACSFVPIKAIGWHSGHKTNYCKNYGYEMGNFNQGEYSNGGICMSGPEPNVCQDKVTNKLDPKYDCTTEGILTKCVHRH